MGSKEAGVALIVVGVFILLFALYLIFGLGGGAVRALVQGSTLLDEEVVVPAAGYRSWCYNLSGNVAVHVSLDVLSGGSRDVNFIVMSYDNYQLFTNGEAYYYYSEPSRFRVTSVDEDWVAPAGGVCFVLDNTFSLVTPKNVKIVITAKAQSETTLPQIKYVLQGLFALIGGAVLVITGAYVYRKKSKQTPPPPPPPPPT